MEELDSHLLLHLKFQQRSNFAEKVESPTIRRWAPSAIEYPNVTRCQASQSHPSQHPLHHTGYADNDRILADENVAELRSHFDDANTLAFTAFDVGS